MSTGAATGTGVPGFDVHPLRGPANAWFFSAMGGYIDALTRERKAALFRDLPEPVVEIGPGVGANFRFLRPGTRVVAVEPNPHMHTRLRRAAERSSIDLELCSSVAERTGLESGSAGSVISSLVLCTVPDPEAALREIHRVLRPGGRYAFLEHVVAPEGTTIRTVQRWLARPWAWAFEGCSCERDLEPMIRASAFAHVRLDRTVLVSPFVPANPQIWGVAIR